MATFTPHPPPQRGVAFGFLATWKGKVAFSPEGNLEGKGKVAFSNN